MDYLTGLDALHALYGTPGQAATVKVTAHLTATYRTWIAGSRFVILTTVGPEGTARLTADSDMRARFAKAGALPRTVAIIRIAGVYSQCARALIRSGLWTVGDQSAGVPTVGDMLRDVTDNIDGAAYDAAWPARAATTLW